MPCTKTLRLAAGVWLPMLLALAIQAGTPAAVAAPQWWALDAMPPGTPPAVQCLPGSDPNHTVLDVRIHGFWYETIFQMGQTFLRLSFDKTHGDALYQQIGRPELPAVQHVIGNLVGGQIQAPVVQVFNQLQLPGALIYPVQPPQTEDAPAQPFHWDMGFYQQTGQPYPFTQGGPRGNQGRFDGLDLLAAETYPFRVIPATQTLLVAQHYTVTLMHSGPQPPVTQMITRRRAAQYQRFVDNEPVILAYRPVNYVVYQGEYLVICGPTFEDEIQPLAEQKRRRGFGTRVVTTIEAGDTCSEIRDFILDWWNEKPTADHYVLLVGDMGEIGVCTSENLTASDLLYVCVDGLGADGLADPYPEAQIGRFPCITETECAEMVTKTLTYEDGYPLGGSWLDDVLLTAHKCAQAGDCDNYKDAQEAVRTYGYSDPPTFTTKYGQDGASDAQVRAAVDDGVGVLCYRGHGSTTAWTGWNMLNESFNLTDVGDLSNGERTPVVFSIACQNNDISGVYQNVPECIGEKWMKTTERAVAHFGATQCSDRSANNILDLELFKNLYEDGNTILGETIVAATATMMAEDSGGEDNAWMYLLLGDPELEVWTEAPPPLFLAVDPSEPGVITVHVSTGSRSPLPLATVAVYKAGEVAAAYYTNASGEVQIPIDVQTPGPLTVTAYTEIGPEGVASENVELSPTASLEVSGAAAAGALALQAPRPNPAKGTAHLSYELPRPGRVRITVVDASGRSVATIADRLEEAGMRSVSWNGRDAAGRRVSPGVYFVRLEQGGETRAVKLTLVW